MTTTRALRLTVHAIDPAVLDTLRADGRDALGSAVRACAAEGGEPLRCCLTVAAPDAAIALVSYSPMRPDAGPWREYGPVFVHAERCAGHAPDAGLPPALRTGPRVLRCYAADGSMTYDANTVVEPGADVEEPLRQLLARPDVDEVHVRALVAQCFAYAVRAAG